MEGTTRCKQRPVRCCFERHRLEEELLVLAYERLWLQWRRIAPRDRVAIEDPLPRQIAEAACVARRA